MSESIFFEIFPYVAFSVAVAVGLYRYYRDRFSYSSVSSQFLENRVLFWGSVPWHYAIIAILIIHVLVAAFPGLFIQFHKSPVRMFVVEIIGTALAALSWIGLILLILRRILIPAVRAETSVMDWVLLFDLLLQITAGLYIAVFYRWGARWYIYTGTPWLRSLVSLAPNFAYISPLPWLIRFHEFNAFVLIGLFPFTRLVHIFTVPFSYLWRPYQVIIWNRLKSGRARTDTR